MNMRRPSDGDRDKRDKRFQNRPAPGLPGQSLPNCPQSASLTPILTVQAKISAYHTLRNEMLSSGGPKLADLFDRYICQVLRDARSQY